MMDPRSSIVALVILLAVGCREQPEPASLAPPTKIRVTISLRFHDEAQTDGSQAQGVDNQQNFPAARAENIEMEMSVYRGETVHDLLKRLMAEGITSFMSTGTGENTFVVAIGGFANQGAGGKNWTYRINGELVKKSCGVALVNDGDRIEWTYGFIQMN